MPRGKAQAVTTEQGIFSALTAQLGGIPDYTIADLDPDCSKFCQAILEVTAAGGSLFMRSGSGGQSLGIAIWEGDTRHPAKWMGDAEGINAWSEAVLELVAKWKEGRQKSSPR